MNNFTDLGLSQPILKALAAEGYVQPTPIQAQAIPHVLAGSDLLGLAQTGTGKTAAFALPILQTLSAAPRRQPRQCRVLVLAPTRELASQIGESFRVYGRHLGTTVAVVVGGVKYGPQARALSHGVDVLVATPGRLIDHVEQKTVDLSATEILVLDEVDQMLDLGFIVPIRKIAARLPKERQSLFFSATMPTPIERLAGELLKRPVRVAVTPVASTVERVEQRVLFVDSARKPDVLLDLLTGSEMTRVLVFTRTKRGADRLSKRLVAGGVSAGAIHGDKSQGQREKALAAFKAGASRVLVATDVAARGIDIDEVSHVVNFELPNVAEAYVHRIGRTGRAGREGVAISLCSNDERTMLRDIEKLTRQDIGRGAAPLIPIRPAAAPAHAEPAQHHARSHRGRASGQPAAAGEFRQLVGQLSGDAKANDPRTEAKPRSRHRSGGRWRRARSA